MYSVKYRVGASDLCGRKTLRYSALVDFMQDCSVFHLLTLDELQKHFNSNNIGMYVVSRQIDIKRLPRYSEEITLSTYVYECKLLYGFRNTHIYGEDGKLCAVCYGVGAFISMESKRPVKIPTEIIKTIPLREKAEMDYLPRKISVPEDFSDVKTFNPITIRKYHIDAYEHVNNARYVDLAEEALPLDFDVNVINRIRLDFRTPAKLGDYITPVAYFYKDKVVVDLKNGNLSCALVEFGIDNK